MKSLTHRIVILFSLIIFLAGVSVAAEKKGAPPPTGVLKQGDFAAMLISALRWRQGLPENPTASDYMAIFGGRRTFRYEAEETYGKKTDNASIKTFELYGRFSGKGWVSGVSAPTTVRFKPLIPIAGEYTLTVASKGDGQVWSVGGKSFKINNGDRFREETAGKVHLKAGEQEITANLPSEGAIDWLMLEAPHLEPIEPLDGWRWDEPLTTVKVAEIAAALLGWERAMPDDLDSKKITIAAAQGAYLPPTASTTRAEYLGAFSSKEWVRAGREGAVLQVPLIIGNAGAYNVRIRGMGDKILAELDGKKIEKEGKPYLDWVELGLHRLKTGAHTLILTIPPNGGIDVITLEKRRSAPQDYLKLLGISGNPSDPVTRAQADKLITSLVERFKERP